MAGVDLVVAGRGGSVEVLQEEVRRPVALVGAHDADAAEVEEDLRLSLHEVGEAVAYLHEVALVGLDVLAQQHVQPLLRGVGQLAAQQAQQIDVHREDRRQRRLARRPGHGVLVIRGVVAAALLDDLADRHVHPAEGGDLLDLDLDVVLHPIQQV